MIRVVVVDDHPVVRHGLTAILRYEHGIEVMRHVRAQAPEVRFLVLTTYDTDEYIGPALAVGAQGYLLKDATPDELARGVRAVVAGGAALEPGVAARLLERMHEP